MSRFRRVGAAHRTGRRFPRYGGQMMDFWMFGGLPDESLTRLQSVPAADGLPSFAIGQMSACDKTAVRADRLDWRSVTNRRGTRSHPKRMGACQISSGGCRRRAGTPRKLIHDLCRLCDAVVDFVFLRKVQPQNGIEPV